MCVGGVGNHHPLLANNLYNNHFLLFWFVLWLRGGGKEGQALCRERSELHRAEQADESEASESSRKLEYLQLGTRQPKKPHLTQTRNYTYHNL